jgi:hypothetical protein
MKGDDLYVAPKEKRSVPPYRFFQLHADPSHVYWVDSKRKPVARIGHADLVRAILEADTELVLALLAADRSK